VQDITLPLSSPAWVFLTLMLVALVLPIVAERVRVPGVIGLVLGGLIVGPQVLGLLELQGLVAQLGGFGVLYLMFLAGLELDLDILDAGRRQAGVFGLLTFALPITVGTLAALVTGFRIAAAILIGSFWASHTLVAYPTVRRHGLARDPAVTATLGATVLTDSLALIVLAVVVAAETATMGPELLAVRLALGLGVLLAFAFVALPRVTAWFFRGLGQDGVLRFLFVMCSLLATSVIADLAGTEPIVGAFFAGLALNRLVPNSGFLMRRIEFVGSSLLIPIFLISVGMLIDLSVVTERRTLILAAVFTAVTVATKYGAAWITGRIFGFDSARIGVMFALSVAQAAATLAAAVIGFEAGVIGETTVNAALLVILVTVLLASWTAARAAPRVPPLPAEPRKLGRNVLVPVANIDAAPRLVELALLIARADAGAVAPLHVVTTPTAPAMARGRALQVAADRLVSSRGAEVAGVVRIDASVVRGIANAVLETDASLVVVGWTATSPARRVVLGSVVDDVVARVPAPVAIAHLPHLDVDRIVIVGARGVSRREAVAAAELAGRIARGGGWRIAVCHDDGSTLLGDLPHPHIDAGAIAPRDLLVAAAPGGEALTRAFAELIAAHPVQPIVALRGFAEAPHGFTPVSEMFGE
jgi:Kef-type K+ transport system membrane component KefB/nucleotide-binding universal stress UspA family protein